jgi:branched-chain amino acid transport system permease protein
MTTASMEALTGLRDRSGKGPLKHVGTAVAAVVLLATLAVADADSRSGLLVVGGLALVAGALVAVTAGVARSVAGAALLLLVLHLALGSNPPPLGVLLFGGVIGLLYAMLAFGLIIVYRTSRVLNFAQAQLGVAPAVLGVLLVKVWGWPYLLAFAVALLSGALLGALVNAIVIQRFFTATRLVVSVCTIGVSLVLALLQFYLPTWFGQDVLVDPSPLTTPLSRFSFTVEPVRFTGNAIAIIVVTLAVVVGLRTFFTKTDIGLAIRGAAENADRATLLGISTRRLSLVAWTVSGGLAALAVFLRVPVIGVPVGADIGPSVLLFGLAAAVAARMEHFGAALVAGVAIGIVDQSVYFSTRDPSVAQAVLLPVLLVVMLAQKRATSRGQDSGLSSTVQATEYRPLPPELRSVPSVQWAQVGVGAVILAFLLAVPFLVDIEKQALLSVVVIYAIVAVSLVILTGWAGQISLGQWGFSGVGAFVAGCLASRAGTDFFLTLLAAGVAGAVAAVVIGLPALRIQGLYLAVTTLAFGLATQVYLLSPNYFGNVLPDTEHPLERPVLYGYINLDDPRRYYFVCLVALALALLSARSLRASRTGRAIVAGRDNVRGTQAFGISTNRARLAAFAISGFWAALAGALFAYQQRVVEPGAFPPAVSLLLLIIVVIGGVTSLPGAMLGTLYIGVLRYGGVSEQYQALASGVGVLLLLYFLPGGLAQAMYGARDNFLRRVAQRRGIAVPSLIADGRDTGGPVPEDLGRHLAEANETAHATALPTPELVGTAPSEGNAR